MPPQVDGAKFTDDRMIAGHPYKRVGKLMRTENTLYHDKGWPDSLEEDPDQEFGESLRPFFRRVRERMKELPAMGISYEPGKYEKKYY